MPALSSGQFPPTDPVYHGSTEGFSPGDTIEPRTDRSYGVNAAYGVTNTHTAGAFGLERATMPREGQGRLFSSVYEVEPKSSYDLHPARQKEYDNQVKYRKDYMPEIEAPENTMPIDRAGFNVKEHAAFAFTDSLTDANKTYGDYIIQDTPGGVGRGRS